MGSDTAPVCSFISFRTITLGLLVSGYLGLAGCTALATVGKAAIDTPATLGSISSHIRA